MQSQLLHPYFAIFHRNPDAYSQSIFKNWDEASVQYQFPLPLSGLPIPFAVMASATWSWTAVSIPVCLGHTPAPKSKKELQLLHAWQDVFQIYLNHLQRNTSCNATDISNRHLVSSVNITFQHESLANISAKCISLMVLAVQSVLEMTCKHLYHDSLFLPV